LPEAAKQDIKEGSWWKTGRIGERIFRNCWVLISWLWIASKMKKNKFRKAIICGLSIFERLAILQNP
jgi:hypothetical protein